MFLPQYKLLILIINIYLPALLFFVQYSVLYLLPDAFKCWKMPEKDKTCKNNHKSEILVLAGVFSAKNQEKSDQLREP